MALVMQILPTFGRNVLPPNTKKENAEVLVVASKEIELEVNANKTKYMTMY